MECVITLSPSCVAIFECVVGNSGLTVDTWVHNEVSANRTVVQVVIYISSNISLEVFEYGINRFPIRNPHLPHAQSATAFHFLTSNFFETAVVSTIKDF